MDEDGDEYRSCVAVESELRPKAVAESGLRGAGIRQRGPWQLAILEAAPRVQDRAHVSIADLVTAALDVVPPPEDGKDRRRENLTRTIHTMAKEKDGPIGLVGSRVIFYE